MSHLHRSIAASFDNSDPTIVGMKVGWHAEVYHSWNLPSAVVEFWEHTAHSYGDRGLFLLPGWFQTWWDVFGKTGSLFIIALYSDTGLKGIFPCWINGDGVLDGMANDGYFDFLVDSSATSATLDKFLNLIPQTGLACATFPHLSRLQGNAEAFLDALHRAHFPFWQWVESYAPIVHVDRQTWEELESTFHSKLRNNLKKGRRRAEKEGILKFEEVRGNASIDQVLDEAFEVEGSGWKAKSGTAIIQDPAKIEWYRRISLWAAQQNMLRMYLLRLDGRLIAFDLDLEFGRTVFALKTGYDESVATRFSPGNLMRCEVLRLLVDRPDIDRYDFLGPAFPWKLEWTRDAGESTEVFIYPRSLRGWAKYAFKYGWKQPLKKARKLMFPKYANPQGGIISGDL